MRRDKETVVFAVVRVTAIALLLWAYAKHPIGYYALLRFVVCATCAYGAYYAMKLGRTGWIWVMALVAVLFNPIIPIYLKREHWEVIDAMVAIFLLISIPLLRPAENRSEESTDAKKSSVEYRESIKTIFWGVALVAGACGFWYYLVGNPLNELALIQRARIVPGFIIDTWEDVKDDDQGRAHWYHGATYTYRLPDGREFTQSTRDSPGRLKDEFLDLQQPYPVEVEYLSEDPAISRIKGDGSDSVSDWIWRKVGLGILLLALFLSPGIVLLRNGVRQLKRSHSNLATKASETALKPKVTQAEGPSPLEKAAEGPDLSQMSLKDLIKKGFGSETGAK